MMGPVSASKWSLAFILSLDARGFYGDMRKVTSTWKGSREELKRQTSALHAQHDQVVRNAIAFGTMLLSVRSLISMFKDWTRSAIAFQYQAKAVSVLLGKSDRAGEQLYIRFRKLNPQIREFMPTAVVENMKKLVQAGYQENEILRDMGAILDVIQASAGNLSMETATELGVNLHRGFARAGEGMRELFDITLRASNRFPLTMSQITSALGYSTEAAVTFNQSLGDVMIGLGTLMPVTKTAHKAGTALRNAMNILTKPKTLEFLKEQGIALKDAAGNFRSYLDIYIDMTEALRKIDEEDRKKGRGDIRRERLIREMGGARGAAMFTAVERAHITQVGRGVGLEGRQYADPRAAMLGMRMDLAKAAGSTREMADSMREASQIIEDRLKVAAEHFSIAWGEVLRPMVDQWNVMNTTITDFLSHLMGGGLVGKGEKPGEPGIGSTLVTLGMQAAVGLAGYYGTVALAKGASAGVGFLGRMTSGGKNLATLPGVNMMGAYMPQGGVLGGSKGMTLWQRMKVRLGLGGAYGGIGGGEFGQRSPSGFLGGLTRAERRGAYYVPPEKGFAAKFSAVADKMSRLAGASGALITSMLLLHSSVKSTALATWDYGKAQRARIEQEMTGMELAIELGKEYVLGQLTKKRLDEAYAKGYGGLVAIIIAALKEGKPINKAIGIVIDDQVAALRRQRAGLLAEGREAEAAEIGEKLKRAEAARVSKDLWAIQEAPGLRKREQITDIELEVRQYQKYLGEGQGTRGGREPAVAYQDTALYGPSGVLDFFRHPDIGGPVGWWLKNVTSPIVEKVLTTVGMDTPEQWEKRRLMSPRYAPPPMFEAFIQAETAEILKTRTGTEELREAFSNLKVVVTDLARVAAENPGIFGVAAVPAEAD